MMCVIGNVKERDFWKETRPLWLLGGQKETSKIHMLHYINRENNPGHHGGCPRAFPSAPFDLSKVLCILLSLKTLMAKSLEGCIGWEAASLVPEAETWHRRCFLVVSARAHIGKCVVLTLKLCIFHVSKLATLLGIYREMVVKYENQKTYVSCIAPEYIIEVQCNPSGLWRAPPWIFEILLICNSFSFQGKKKINNPLCFLFMWKPYETVVRGYVCCIFEEFMLHL